MKILTSWYKLILRLFRKSERNIEPFNPSVERLSKKEAVTTASPSLLETPTTLEKPNGDHFTDGSRNQPENLVIPPSNNSEVDSNEIAIPEALRKSWRFNINEYQPFCPNWGDLDPTVSTISNGRIENERLNYLCDEFTQRYGKLTTALGYGIIYSIVKNAIEIEERSVSSALKEAIVRSNDPFLCVAVVKDYCNRKKIHFDKYEKITDDILRKRALLYGGDFVSYVGSEPAIASDERHELIKSNWLFNGKILEIYPNTKGGTLPLYMKVRIPSLDRSHIIRDFNRSREWRLNQNIVVQMDAPDSFRVLDFSRTNPTNAPNN